MSVNAELRHEGRAKRKKKRARCRLEVVRCGDKSFQFFFFIFFSSLLVFRKGGETFFMHDFVGDAVRVDDA